MKKIFLFIIGCLFFINSSMALPNQLDGIAAIVNNNIITLSQLYSQVQVVKAQLTQQKIEIPPAKQLQQQVLQMMISQELVTQAAARMGISVSDEDVNAYVENIAQQQNTTAEHLRQEVVQHGIPEKRFLTDLRQQLTNQKILRDVLAPQVTVTPQEISTELKKVKDQGDVNMQYHLLQIIVPLPDSPTPAEVSTAENKADNIMQQLSQGVDFKMLAAAESSGDQTFSGGDLGWKTLAELPAAYADKVGNMKNNEVAGPFQAANGIHIIKLIASRAQHTIPDQAKLKERVANMIFQRKLQERQQAWVEELRAGAYVKVLYEPEDLPTPA